MTNKATYATQCYHCGDAVGDTQFEFSGHAFCCQGCMGAYHLITENNLCGYYDIEKAPGNQVKNLTDPSEFAFLDEKSIQKRLLQFTDGEVSKISIKLPQIHCSSCIWLLENLHDLNKGILSSRVNFSSKTIHISYSERKTSLRQVVELLGSFGYIPELNLESSNDKKAASHTNRGLYYKIGLAGFCFGNIMLMSFPEYIGVSGDFKTEFVTLFRWLNVLLVLPVLFYSASDYLQNALNAIKTGILNLDVPIVLGMAALFFRSLYEVFTGTGQGYFDSLVGFIFFLLLGKLFQARTYRHLSFERDFKSFFPLAVMRKQDQETKPCPVTELQVADIIVVKNDQIIPCDSLLLSADAQIDYSFVTGEAEPSSHKIGDILYAGGRLAGPSIELLVEKRVENGYLAELWHSNKNRTSSQLSAIADTIGKYFTIAILIVSTFTLLYWWWVDPSKAVLSFTSVLIVACPCALALSIPFTTGTAMRWLSKRGFFLKHSSVVEKLSQINHLVFDKTGTLTESRKATIDYNGLSLKGIEKELSTVVQESSHPLSRQIANYLGNNAFREPLDSFAEFPGKGIEASFKGTVYRLGSNEFIQGSSLNGINSTQVHLEVNGQYYGRFKISIAYRKGLKTFIEDLASKYKMSLLSGDSSKEKNYLQQIFGANKELKFNQSPHDKELFVKNLRTEGGIVAMVGDGLNDAGALLESDLGISITEDVNNFTPASDIIAKAEVLTQLPSILLFSKKAKHIIYAAFAISFAYNIIGLSFAIQGMLSPVVSAILMPLSSITVVLFTTISTSLVAKKMQLT